VYGLYQDGNPPQGLDFQINVFFYSYDTYESQL